MAGVFQIKGKENILQAFDNAKVEVWAIFVGRNLITKGCGADMLESFLDLVTQNGSNGVYTLKLYEDIDDAKKVKEKTEASGSLNFILNADDFVDGSGFKTISGIDRRLYDEVQELKRELKEQREQSNQEPQTLEQAAIGLLGDPQGLAAIILSIKELFKANNNNPPAPAYSIPATVGNVHNQNNMATELTEQEKESLSNSIDILIDCDPKIAEHLAKLASIAQTKPSQFKLLLTMLESY